MALKKIAFVQLLISLTVLILGIIYGHDVGFIDSFSKIGKTTLSIIFLVVLIIAVILGILQIILGIIHLAFFSIAAGVFTFLGIVPYANIVCVVLNALVVILPGKK